MKLLITTFIAATIALFSITATAHGDLKPHHGGLVKEVNEVQYELVAKPDLITIYVFDHGKKIKLKDASGKLTILAGKEKTEIALVADAGNTLQAKGNFKVGKGVRLVAIIKNAGKTTSVSWTLK
jgi:hypothetical protein